MNIGKKIFASKLKKELQKEMEKKIEEGKAWEEIQKCLDEHEKLMIKYDGNDTEQAIRSLLLIMTIMKGHDEQTREAIIKTLPKIRGGMGNDD